MSTGRLTLVDQLAQTVREQPERWAVIVDGGDRVSAGDLLARATRVAAALRSRGHRRGDRLAVVATERHFAGFVVACYGIYLLGGCAVPLSAKLPARELTEALEDVQAVATILVGAAPAGWRPAGPPLTLADLLPADPAELNDLPPADAAELSPADAGAAGPVDGAAVCDTDALAYIVRTSGTTGRPKLVAATYGNLCAQYPLQEWTPDFASTVLMTASIGSDATQSLVHDCVRGPTLVVPATFDPRRHCELIEEYQPRVVGLVPSSAIATLAAADAQSYDFSSVRCVVSSSAPLPPAVFTALAERFPQATVYNSYALSEGVGLVNRYADGRPGAIGRLSTDTQLRIVDDAGATVEQGQVGEIWLRHPDQPPRQHLTGGPSGSTRITPDGWVATGDLGRLDEDGFVYFVDRRDDIIVTAGHNVSSAEVEAALAEHPAVRQVAVVGVPHPLLGQAVAAAVTLRTGVPGGDLHAHCGERLAPHKRPLTIVTVPDLPLTATGKVRKDALREQLRAAVAAPSAGASDDPVAALVVEVWAEVGGQPPGLDDDLFDVGGYSLLATQVTLALSTRLDRRVPLALVLSHRTPRLLAAAIAAELAAGRLAARPVIKAASP